MGCCKSKHKVKKAPRATQKKVEERIVLIGTEKEPELSMSEAVEAGSEGTTDSNQLPKIGRRSGAKVEDIYVLGKILGKGGFSTVRLGTDRLTQQQYAIKMMHIRGPHNNDAAAVRRRDLVREEISILMGLQHENIVPCKEYFEEHNKVYLVTELLSGGELLKAVQSLDDYCESDARRCFFQILEGIKYLHKSGVAHRDIKPANILVAIRQDTSQIKLVDFGLAKKYEDPMTSNVGIAMYKAPEILSSKLGDVYTPAVDLWSAGVILFLLLGGSPPFYDKDRGKLQAAICEGKFTFEDSTWKRVSDRAKDLISRLLVVDPDKRLSAAEAQEHPWFEETDIGKESLIYTRGKLQKFLIQHHPNDPDASEIWDNLLTQNSLALCCVITLSFCNCTRVQRAAQWEDWWLNKIAGYFRLFFADRGGLQIIETLA